MVRIHLPDTFDSDVLIVGAGPAGAAAAAHAARAGLRVLLLDGQVFPRDKTCGDFVGPVALLELEALGVAARPEFARTNVVRHAGLHLDGDRLITSALPRVHGLPDYGRVIPRRVLDAFIVDAARAAGADLREGTRVTGYSLDAGGVTVTAARKGCAGETTLRTRLLVGADGSGSLVARQFRGRAAPPGDRIIAVRAYYENVRGPADRADLYFAAETFPGYYWLFPTAGGGANVGLGMMLETVPPGRDRLADLLLRLAETDPALRERLADARPVGRIAGWPLTTYNPRLRIAGERLLLVGDAAGLINPLNGEGIQYALLSGRWAAEAAAACAARGDFSLGALRSYDDRVQRELRYDMALSRLVVEAIRNRSLNPVWLQALRVIVARARTDPRYADITGGILAGLVPASSVLSARVVGGTAGQAAIAAGSAALAGALRGPAHWAALGVETGHVGGRVARDMLRCPLGFARWGSELASAAVELAGQAGMHLLQADPAAAAPREPRVRLVAGPTTPYAPEGAPVDGSEACLSCPTS